MDKNTKDLKKKNKKAVVTTIILTSLLVIVTSLAYFTPRITIFNNSNNTISGDVDSTTADITVTGLESAAINLTGTYPMTTATATETLDPLTFTITNNSTKLKAKYNIILDVKNGNTLTKNELISTSLGGILTTGTEVNATDSGYTKGYIIYSGVLNPSETKEINLRVWINENGNNITGDANNVESKTWLGKIIVKASKGEKVPVKPKCIDSNGNEMTCPQTLEVGQRIAIGDEVFRFIRYTSTSSNLNECGGETGTSTACGDATNGDIRALAEYNLYVGHIYNSSGTKTGDIATTDTKYGKQDSTARGWVSGADRIGTTEFSSASVKGTNYSSYSGSIVEDYVEEYVQYLSDEYDATVSGGLITKYEIMSLCNLTGRGTCANTNPWVYTTSYWSGSPGTSNYVWLVYSDAHFNGYTYDKDSNFGVRPVITISASDI